jgi:hypothetical protein
MSVTITVSDEVAQHLESLSFGQAGGRYGVTPLGNAVV